MNKVLETTRYVVENSTHVRINHEKVNEFSAKFKDDHVNHWLNVSPVNFSAFNDEQKLNFLLVFNAISFCYWGEPKWTIDLHGNKYDGAFGMIACIGRATENRIPILDMDYLATISKSDLQKILKGNTEIPLLNERLLILHEIGKNSIEKNSIEELIEESETDASTLIPKIIQNYPSFSDATSYKRKKSYFNKRVQLLISDIYQMFNGKKYGKFENISELTACADYKLPKMLRQWGMIKYSPALSQKIDQKTEISKNSEEEVEIRANTIWAIEYAKQKIKKKIPHIDSIHVNDRIWLMSQTKTKNDKPYHRTRTTAY